MIINYTYRLLHSSKFTTSPFAHTKQLSASWTTIHVVSKSETLEKSKKKSKLDPDEFKKKTKANPHKSLRVHARDLGALHQTVQRAFK
uniref:Uncharacterized protein n=1 Tax=Lepeophtheirus salmonis TaxID=72036 RepID=A0A0K2U650_LEPSM